MHKGLSVLSQRMTRVTIVVAASVILAGCASTAATATLTVAQPATSVPPTAAAPTPPAALPSPTMEDSLRVSLGGAYLMAFHACDAFTLNCSDPRNHQVYLAESNDGLTWNLAAGWQPFPGSVPDVIRRGDTVYIYTGPSIVRLHLQDGTADAPATISLRTADGATADVLPTDVSLIVDDQGHLVIFFLYGTMGSDPAMCAPGEATCVKRIGSATEVEGTDGAEFVLDEGDRLSVSIGAGTPFQSVSDPDISTDGRDAYLLLSHGPWMTVWTSTDLRGSYRQLNVPPMGFLTAGSGGVGASHFDASSGTIWLYSHIHQQVGMVIRRATVKDFARQLEEPDWTTVLTGESLGLGQGVNVESPGVAVNRP